ncbi:MAG: FlgO family outer membrane protein [Bacteroidota bacterium]
MKKILFLFLVFSISLISQNKTPLTIAVLYFENASMEDRDRLEPMRKGLADMFITEMLKVKGLKVVERARMQSIIEELNLNEMDFVAESMQQKMGKILGAKFMLFGTFANLPGDEIRIDARIVNVETSEILHAEDESGDLDDFMELIQSLVKKIAKDLSVKLSSAEEDALDTGGGSFDAYVNYCEAIDLDDDARRLHREGKFDEAIIKISKAKDLYDKAFKNAKKYVAAKNKSDEAAKYKLKILETKKEQ